MDPFPRIAPTARIFVPGNVPSAFQTALSGTTSGYRFGNRRVGQSLSLTFAYLTETQMNSIKTHYINANGTYDIFFLSAEIWADFKSPPVPLLSDIAWRYAQEPSIEDVSFDRFTLEVELVSYAIDFSDLIIDGGTASTTPGRDYIIDGGGASATPARDYVINSGAAT